MKVKAGKNKNRKTARIRKGKTEKGKVEKKQTNETVSLKRNNRGRSKWIRTN